VKRSRKIASAASKSPSKRGPKFTPKLIIFDVDGVLVDVRGSFHRSIIDTVRHFTGKRGRARLERMVGGAIRLRQVVSKRGL